MRDSEEYSISKWEEDLPSPEDLTPLSQTLISPHLALAFNIQTPSNHHHHNPISAEFDSSSDDDPARTLKRPRLVWTPQLHKRFVDAVSHLGIKNAVPKTIMQMMSVDGLTRENVASHLQKYRLYLKRMQGHVTKPDAAADRLFSSSPVPAHFLHHPPPLPLPLLALHHHHQHQLAATMGYHQHQLSGGGGGGGGGGWQMMMRQNSGLGYGEDVESVNGKRVLTLFPTAD